MQAISVRQIFFLVFFFNIPGGNTKVFLGGSSTNKYNDDCDQALIKGSWRFV